MSEPQAQWTTSRSLPQQPKGLPKRYRATALQRLRRFMYSFILFFTPRRRRLPRHRPVDVNHLLGEQPLVQALDRLTSSDPPAPSERPFKRGGDGFGSLVDADLTALDALQSLPHVADRDRDDWQIASQRLLHHIRRSLLAGREDEDIARAHIDWDLGVRHAPGDDQLGGQSLVEYLHRPPGQIESLPFVRRVAGEENQPPALRQPQPSQ